MKICFATNNRHKLKEISRLLGADFQVVSLQEIGCKEELPENQETLEGNSIEKAQYVYDHYGIDCFADDTGLEVSALNNAPGVYSARYAGIEKDSRKNMDLLLQNLAGKGQRNARFRTIITLFWQGKRHQFKGAVSGHIAEKRQGNEGFGYDPVFIPQDYKQSFAEMAIDEKNKISHRGKATRALVDFLKFAV